VRSVILALFACILFFGSCILCLSDLQPKTSFGMPLLAAAGFLFSISLAIYTVKLMSKKK
jgi:ubiquinone biosynthesis protein